ncbi:hypothetical protein KSP40_PGU018235 [Platanthera guangdongensis]|uniref:HAT C-terminal dimerisation domain-containing protein n=1 Tax=Platanthera guangdongensis TaxID=2320717 RepID=A0ABR2MUZ2_9ASPA
MTVHVLGLTTSSSGCKRNWSTFELVNSYKKREIDYHKRVNDLVFIKFNATIKTWSMEYKRDLIAAKTLMIEK